MCLFSVNQELCNGCGKVKYGGYCYKHRRNYLVNDKQTIEFNHFTSQSSDYLKKDIVKTISMITGTNPIKEISSKKGELFKELVSLYTNLHRYSHLENLQKVVKIQRYYKQKNIQLFGTLRGEGFKNPLKCQNDTDFFTYETYNELDPKYFFSYKDVNGFIWFFDIRSFLKLVELNQSNPYTREDIPQKVIDNAQELSDKLQLYQPEEPEVVFQNRNQRIKQKTIDVFSKIEQLGYECNFEWFIRLRRRELRNLYKNLEDIWNYRLQLTYAMKSSIAPPNGLVFTTSLQEVMGMDKQDLQELILQEVLKFDGARTESDKKLGFMYFIIGLGSVSLDCHNAHPWLLYV